MKKQIIFWLVMFLAVSLLLPGYSTAQTTLTLEDSTGNRISTPGIKSFAMGTDNNLVIFLDQPFNFTDLVPDILLASCTSCTITGPAGVTATQGTNLSFNVQSSYMNAVISLVAASNEIATMASRNGSALFSWNTGNTPTGSYLAVFQALDTTVTPNLKSQLVVMIKVNPAETVTPPTAINPLVGTTNQPINFTASGATVSTSGHTVEYRFDWNGDSASVSGWSASAQAHTYASTGTFPIKAQARCATDQVVSTWYTGSVTISNVQTYTVTVSVVNSAGGSVSPSSQTVTSGGTATFTVTTNSGYTASVTEGTLSGTTWTIPSVISTHTATITFTQAGQGDILQWNINSLSPGAMITFNAGETKTFIARVTSNIKGFDVIFYPMQDFIITCNFKMPLKPNGTPYTTTLGITEFIGLKAGYESAISIKLWTTSMGGIVLDSFIYPGDFIVTMTANRTGWGYMNTSLYP